MGKQGGPINFGTDSRYYMKLICPLFVFICLIGITLTHAQTLSIKGRIIDAKSQSPVEYASAALFSIRDSSLVAGSVSDANGNFEIKKVPQGKYQLRIAFLGYETRIIKDISGSDLGVIQLSPSTSMLSEVGVTGTKIANLNKIDKQQYEAGQFEAAKGGSAIDVIKNLPSVSVNSQGDITMRGATGFMVLLNGKPVLADVQTVLSQLPANAIDHVELITAPSAKYDPDGRGGIINIIMKRGMGDNFSLSINTQGGLPATIDYDNLEKPKRFGGDMTIAFKKGKWDVSAGGNYTRNDNEGYREGDVYTKNFDKNTITRFPSNGERSFDRYNYAGRASVSFAADPKNIISAGFYSGKRYQERRADLLYHNTTSDLTTGELINSANYFNSNLQRKEGTFNLGNLDFTHTFGNKSTLSAGLQYEHDNLYGGTLNRNLQFPNTKDTIQFVDNPYRRPISAFRAKVDHSTPIGTGQLESGLQYRYDTQDGTFDYNVTPATDQPDLEKFRGTTHAVNKIYSVYSQYKGRQGALEYNGGLRYEYAERTVRLSYDDHPHLLNLSNLFPSANVLYHFSKSWSGKAGYSKRIQRTSNLELNPIPEREHSETLEEGDPDLLPEFVDLAELGMNYTFDKGSFFGTLYYQQIKNPIQRLNSVYADTILNRVYTNAGTAKLFGLEAGLNVTPVKWWTLYLGANLYNYRVYGNIHILDEPVTISNQRWAYSINGNTSFQLDKTWNIQLSANYLSKRPTGQGQDGSFLVPNTTIRKSLMNGRLKVALLWQNMNMGILGANKQRITTYGPAFFTTTNYISETDVLMINVGFSLNRIVSKLKLPVSETGEREF